MKNLIHRIGVKASELTVGYDEGSSYAYGGGGLGLILIIVILVLLLR